MARYPNEHEEQAMADEAAKLDNTQLFAHVLSLVGSRYIGNAHTEIRLEYYIAELKRRLRHIGFLPLTSVDTARGSR